MPVDGLWNAVHTHCNLPKTAVNVFHFYLILFILFYLSNFGFILFHFILLHLIVFISLYFIYFVLFYFILSYFISLYFLLYCIYFYFILSPCKFAKTSPFVFRAYFWRLFLFADHFCLPTTSAGGVLLFRPPFVLADSLDSCAPALCATLSEKCRHPSERFPTAVAGRSKHQGPPPLTMNHGHSQKVPTQSWSLSTGNLDANHGHCPSCIFLPGATALLVPGGFFDMCFLPWATALLVPGQIFDMCFLLLF
jgi:hypothetical protein